MIDKKDSQEFLLFLKLKKQTIQNAPSSKKYSMIKEISLQDGENLIGSDICKCNIYLPFEDMPDIMGKITVKNEDSVKKFFLTDYGKSSTFFLSKMRGKQLVSNKEVFLRPHQKIYIGSLVEMHVQMIFTDDGSSMCFEEEENKEEKKEAWNLQEEQSDVEEGELKKRNSQEFEEKKQEDAPVVTLQAIAKDREILKNVKNPFNLGGEEPSKGKKMTTPKKKRGKKKKESEEKTSLKIINYFKIIEKNKTQSKNADEQETAVKSDEKPTQVKPKPSISQKLFQKTPTKRVTPKAKDKRGPAPDPTKFSKSGDFINLTIGNNGLEENLHVIRTSLKTNFFKQKVELNENKLENKVLSLLMKKADIIQNNPIEEKKSLVEDLKKLSKLKWWICFSNISLTKKHKQILKTLKEIPNIFVFEDFEKFVNTGDQDPQIQKVLIMEKYKRTYKLIVAMNKNILPLSYKWIADVATNKNIFSNPSKNFIEYPNDQKILPGYNKSNVVGWFKHHSHKFTVDLRLSYLKRKQSSQGFLENHNIIIYDKCFRGIRLENLNINRHGPNMPNKVKTRGIRSSQKENDNKYIMRRIVETADGKLQIINNLNKVKDCFDKNTVNVLIVNNFEHQELSRVCQGLKIKVYSKESFMNSFLKQYLHSNEQFKIENKTTA